MAGDFLRSLLRALSGRDAERPGSYDARTHTHCHWRCECGAHSRGGWLSASDAEYGAQRHQMREGVGHPMPSIFSTPGMNPSDIA